jgi:hypothetical protein
MGAAVHRMIEVRSFDRIWWLPAGGFGNGVDDAAWVAAVDVLGEPVAREVLTQLAAAAVPAYAAPLRHLEAGRAPTRHGPGGDTQVFRVWVGSSRFGGARDALLVLLPGLVADHGDGVIV